MPGLVHANNLRRWCRRILCFRQESLWLNKNGGGKEEEEEKGEGLHKREKIDATERNKI